MKLRHYIFFIAYLISNHMFFSASAQTIIIPPYLQPGNAPGLKNEMKVVMWQTDSVEGAFVVECKAKSPQARKLAAKVTSVKLHLNGKQTILYKAVFTKLQFDTQYTYTVSLNGKPITTSDFITRTQKNKTHFIVMGDCGVNSSGQFAIAKRMAEEKPDFILTTGDNVYNDGRESEYRKRFFPAYLPMTDSSSNIMQTTTFYLGVGNHDVRANDLSKYADGLAYFYYNDLPLNGPATDPTLKVTGDEQKIADFKTTVKTKFPRMLNYSFDHGNVHIACIDANIYANPLDPKLIEWLKNDIGKSTADWKIVEYHHPPFNSSNAHYNYQYMRLLAPVLESLNVDIVFNGHVHNYQRTVPLTFSPEINKTGDRYVIAENGQVNGTFTLDSYFNGKSETSPNGVIYIVTGAGGAPLYDQKLSNTPELWKHEPKENWVPFTKKLISDVHSFTIIDTDGKKLVLKQVSVTGELMDTITITK